MSIVTDSSAESLMTETVKKARHGSIMYTDKWREYNSLMFCGYGAGGRSETYSRNKFSCSKNF